MALTESQNTDRLSRVPLAGLTAHLRAWLNDSGHRSIAQKMAGAAIATATALIVESLLLFWATKRRLGFHVLIWGRP